MVRLLILTAERRVRPRITLCWMKWHRNKSTANFFGLPFCSLFQRYITLTLHPSLSCPTVLTRQHINTSSVCKLEISFLTWHVTRGSEEVEDVGNRICGYIITSKNPVEISKRKFERLYFKLRFSQTFLLCFFIYKPNLMYKLQTRLKVCLLLFLHVSASLCHPQGVHMDIICYASRSFQVWFINSIKMAQTWRTM